MGAGLKVARIEIDAEGRIIIVSGEPTPHEALNELDAWKAKRNARAS